MRIGGLEKILRKSAMFLVSSSLAFNLINCGGKDEGPTAPINQAPETTIISGPSGTIEENNVTFEWTGTDDESVDHYEYRLSPIMDLYEATYNTSKTFTGLENGNYTLYVRAIDNKEMGDPTPDDRTFTVSKLYTLIIQPDPEGIDAYVKGWWEDGQPTDVCGYNFGDYGIIEVLCIEYMWEGIYTIVKERSYIKFPLDEIPSNVDIEEALIGFYKYWSDSIATTYDIGLYNVTSSWEEFSITWNNQPTFDNSFEDIVSNSIYVGWWTFDATNLVEDWYNNNLPNNGLALKILFEESEEGYPKGSSFYSGDYMGDPSKRPKLEIKYK